MTPQKILQALYAGEISLEEAKEALKLDATLSAEQGTLTPSRLQGSETVGTGNTPVPKASTALGRREAIAIVGMSGRYPDAKNLAEYWDNLVQGKNAIREIPPTRFDVSNYYDPNPATDGKIYCKWLGALDEIEYFDPLFFHIAPADADAIDPQHRLFLEEGYKAFEDAGYSPQLLSNRKCGVYLGLMSHEYDLLLHEHNLLEINLLGTGSAIAAARIAYLLNLKGPAICIDTACSSSLVATHLACQALTSQEIDMALVGGVSLYLTLGSYVGMCSAGMLSPDGQCKAFDTSANGFVPGEGAGALVLKRLADAEADHDQIYGVIVGSGMNQDGATNGITAPSAKSQIDLEREIYERYQIDPASISYVEMHGTGTKLGDPIELDALATVFQEKTQRKQYCAIGSVKSNIGHTSAAAGVASVQKVLLAIKQKKLVPTLHFQQPNEHFDFAASPFYVNTEVQDWKSEAGTPRRAAVSSFGLSGTNAHLVIEEYVPERQFDRRDEDKPYPETPSLFVLSAKSEQQLKSYAQDMRCWIQARPELALQDIAFTLQVGRTAMDYRLGIVADSNEILLQRLEGFVNNHASAGVYTAQVKHSLVGGPNLPSRSDATLFEADEDTQSLLYMRNLEKLARAWVRGANIDWMLLYTAGVGQAQNLVPTTHALPYRTSLPTYPFARERYWIPTPTVGVGKELSPSEEARTLLLTPTWKEVPIAEPVGTGAALLPYSNGIGASPSLVMLCDLADIEASRLQAQLAEGGRYRGLKVIHWHSQNPRREQCFQEAVVWLIHELQRLLHSRPAEPMLVQVVVARRKEPSLLEALIAVLKTVQQEYPKLHGQLIEVEGEPEERVLLAWLRENQYTPRDQHIRYRNGKRWVQGWQEVDGGNRRALALQSHRPPVPANLWKEGGCYLISGGAGGLARLFVQEIAKQVQNATVVLVGRSALSAPQHALLSDLAGVQTSGARHTGYSTTGGIYIDYQQCDVSDGPAVHALVQRVLRQHGHLNGIIHAAGVLRDRLLLTKTQEDVRAVLAPKIIGVEHLDDASSQIPLDFFLLCSSLSAVMGNVGQADYAAANAYLDAFAHARQAQVLAGERQGATLSINWPLWEEGGMRIEVETAQMMRERLGVEVMGTETGIRTLYQALACEQAQVIVLYGQANRIKQQLMQNYYEVTIGIEQAYRDNASHEPFAVAEGQPAVLTIEQEALREKASAYFKKQLAAVIKAPVQRIDAEAPLLDYGFNSMMAVRFINALEGTFGPLSKTLLFEYPTLQSVTEYFLQSYPERLRSLFGNFKDGSGAVPAPLGSHAEITPLWGEGPASLGGQIPPKRMEVISAWSLGKRTEASPAPTTPQDDIAIIGIAGRYPQAGNLNEYWQSLRSGRDCITEIPEERWPLEGFYHPDFYEAVEQGKSYSKWGGFVEGFADFDPLFFHLSPREALSMDPQERLFIETCWEALEDAGYNKEQLALQCNRKVGVFAGITQTGFNLYGPDLWKQGNPLWSPSQDQDLRATDPLGTPAPLQPHTSFSSVANRVSYLLDLQGPSMPIDTMCSSSLTALHEACEHIHRGECEMAFAGGVNLYLHPSNYIALCAHKMLSVDGRCRSFGEGGNGFVPGEGVGVVLLKRLSRAIADHDQIYAVIRATGINHGGATNGYTVPNPTAQRELIRTTLDKAGIHARMVSYIEAHGTGTELGDPIEVTGLTQAFRQDTQDTGFCALGSVKSNIGHLEAAAGIAGMTKIVLQMKHRQIVPSLHAKELNAHINFAQTPFVVQQESTAWKQPLVEINGETRECPRIAGISSFGAGGANAHVILEEYVPDAQQRPAIIVDAHNPAIIVLSARNAEQLKMQAQRLLAVIIDQQFSDESLADLAYTLQVGREAMEERLAIIAESIKQLAEKLGQFVEDRDGIDDMFRGTVKHSKEVMGVVSTDEDIQKAIETWVAKRKYHKLLDLWVKGLAFDWNKLYENVKPYRISLPTYPFVGERLWIPRNKPEPEDRATSADPIKSNALHSPPGLSRLERPVVQHALQPTTQAGTTSPKRVGKPKSISLQKISPAPQEVLQDELTTSLAETLFVAPDDINRDENFVDLGLDPVLGMEWIQRLNKQYGLSLPATKVYDHPTIRTFADFLANEWDTREEGTPQAQGTQTTIPQLEKEMTAILAQTLYIEQSAIDREKPFREMGLDSVLGVEWIQSLNKQYGLSLPATKVYDYPTIRQMAGFLQKELLQHQKTPVPSISPRVPDNAHQQVQKKLEGGVIETYRGSGLSLPRDSSTLTKPTYQHVSLERPGGINDFTIKEADILELKEKEVRVAVHAFSLNFGDLLCVKGLYPTMPPYPFTPGFEASGIVLDVGQAVTAFQSGDPVIALAGATLGGQATMMTCQEEHIFHKPASLSFEEACALPVVAITMIAAFEKARLKWGEKILIQTATGGTGLIAIQLANYYGAQIYATAGSEAKLNYLKQLGVSYRINYQETDFEKEIQRLTQGQGVDVVINTLSGDAIQKGMNCLAPGGRYIEIAMTALKSARTIDLSVLSQNQTFYSVDLRKLEQTDPAALKPYFDEMFRLVDEGIITPTICQVFDWERLKDAYRYMENRQHIGKIVVRIPRANQVSQKASEQWSLASHDLTVKHVTPAGLEKSTSALWDQTNQSSIAIIGMSGQFPRAKSLSEFWDNLAQGVDCISEVPTTRWSIDAYYDTNHKAPGKTTSKWMGVLEDADKFDPLFFNISPSEAEWMDPQQRLFLESCWHCIEDAGLIPSELSGSRCSVFVGCAHNGYGQFTADQEINAHSLMGCATSILAARVAYLLNLKGPTLAIDTACSSSLVAIAEACNSLVLQTSDLALAGGVSVTAGPSLHIMTSKAGMLSKDGRCFTFDKRANGFVIGEGVGVILLKRLSDAVRDGDPIHGVIRGWGTNQDGKTNGITAPSANAQILLEQEVYERFGINPEAISLVEAHGTATKLGDPIEVEALTKVFQSSGQGPGRGKPYPANAPTNKQKYCALGSVKSNIGHLLTAAGIAGVIKVLLALKYQMLPPMLHFAELNEHISLDNTPFYINTHLQPWEVAAGMPRCAAVSSFGFSGTNAHLVIEEYVPEATHNQPSISGDQDNVLVFILSAKSEEQLKTYAERMRSWIASQDDLSLADLAYTLQMGREAMDCRLAFSAYSREELLKALEGFIHQSLPTDVFIGQISKNKEQLMVLQEDEEAQSLLHSWIKKRKLSKIAELWVNGFYIDWQKIYGDRKLRRINLPTYPFARESYWIFAHHRDSEGGTQSAIPATSQPSISQNPLHLSNRHSPSDVAKPDELLTFAISYFANILSTVLKISPEKLDREARFDEYGLDSILIQRLHAIIEDVFGPIPATTFFQYKCLRDLAGYFLTEHAEKMHALFRQRSQSQPLQPQNVEEGTDIIACNPQDRAPIIHQIQRSSSDQREQIESLHAALGQPVQEMDEILTRLLWVQLQTSGWFTEPQTSIAELKARVGLPTSYNRWLDETIAVFAQRKYLSYDALSRSVTGLISIDSEICWHEWKRKKAVWLADPDLKARVVLVEATLHALPEILTGQTTATAILFPKSSMELLDGIFQRNRMADFFNTTLADTVVAYLNEIRKLEGSARLRILEIGAGTGGTSAMVFQKLLPYQEYIQEYCYTDLSQAFLWHAQQSYGPQNPYLTYEIFNVEVPLADQNINPNSYDLVIAANVLHATHNIRQALRNAKALLKRDGLLLINETCVKSMFLHLTFGLLEGWWLYEDSDLRFPGSPFLEWQTWQTVLQQEGFRHIFFPVRGASKLGQQIIVASASVPNASDAVACVPHANGLDQSLGDLSLPQTTGSLEPGEARLTLEDGIAIIGIRGQYPQAADLDAFWSNLEAGKDCIVEIPKERWDYHAYYKPQNGAGGKTGGMYCKWGGFLPDVDKFDPLFFHISPFEARFMDPQERLFLQTVAACFEDAGYSKRLLRDESAGDGRANVGVFAGVTYNNYQLYLLKEYEKDNVVPVNSQTYSIANRVSYIYNLRGPSITLDTACSGSLVAIHMACESIKRGECAMAIAGGVNLSLHPSKYTSLCVSHFASSNGHCCSFGEDGDGIVPGEGVGVVLLKPLSRAIADGDHIYAAIKGTAINNDGKTFGYSVPNPVAQTEVIRKALKMAHVDPHTISYVEAHGTGTKLGDPIEITGLSDAFKEYTSDKQFCAIGSVKSNIGHLEAAAGISQVTKVVLQMKHKKLVPSLLHTTRLNPNIDFENTPFFVQQSLQEWRRPALQVNGEEVVYPRRAGISSFGAGGVNAHIILEEYQAKDDKGTQAELDKQPLIIVLSAKKDQNLRDYARRLKDYMEKYIKGPDKMAKLKDIAYTLQTGRDPMVCRLAFTAKDAAEIIEKLEIFLNHRETFGKNGLYVGYRTAEKQSKTEVTEDDLKTVRSSPAMGEKMVELWASGREIDWERVYQNERRLRVPLPTYPFSKERYWAGDQPEEALLEPPIGMRTETVPVPTVPVRKEENERTEKPESSPFLTKLCQAPEGERQGMIEKYLQDLLAGLLAFNPPDVPELHQGFFDMGMESVKAEQFRVSLEECFLLDIADTAVFDYPNISELSEYIVKCIPYSEIEKQLLLPASRQEKRLKAELEQQKKEREPIAIIGMGCRFPGGCHDPETFWRFLTEGGDGVIEVPRDRWNIEDFYDPDPDATGKIYLKEAGFLQENVGDFDARFFGISPREAVEMDPQQRLLLEVSWEALERAGIPASQLKGTQTGVFIGMIGSEYAFLPRERFAANPYMLTGCMPNIASGRISYILGAHGPAISIDTACSSSLVAVHLACESLQRGESSLALAGGVSLMLAPDGFLSLCSLHALAKDGRCKTFDADGDGYGRGEGCGIVVLKRHYDALRDKDPILAIIKGTSVNQDGPGSGLTVPNGKAQKALILKTLEGASVSPEDIGYLEVHGTGTALGDPIEFQALTEVFGKENKREKPLYIGSVKSNIGHLEAAAGIASLIKSVLCLQNKKIPPNLHLHKINPKIRLERIPAIVPQEAISWETTGKPRIAGISSFGFSGTNAHVIVSELEDASGDAWHSSCERPLHILVLSAKDEKALSQAVARYEKYFDQTSGEKLENICFTAGAGRSQFPRRIAFIAESMEQMKNTIAGYLRGDKGEGVIEGKGRDQTHPKLAFLIHGKINPELVQTLFETQPIFQKTLRFCDERIQQLANISLLESSGSRGRIREAAGWQADLLSFALHFSLLKLWEAWGIRPSAVLGSQVGEFVAACAAGIMDMETALCSLLEHWAVTAQADGKPLLNPPQMRIISGSTGRPVEKQEATSSMYWKKVFAGEQNREKGIEYLIQQEYKYFLQTGIVAASDYREDFFTNSGAQCFPSVTEVDPWRTLTSTLANLYCLGLDVDWSGFERGYDRRKVILPTYPFQRKYFWCETTSEGLVSQVRTESKKEEIQTSNPLDGRIINSPIKTKQVEYSLNLDAVPDVKDVNGVLHVGYYLEILYRAVKNLYQTTLFRIQTIDFLMALMIPDSGTVTLSLTFTAEKGSELNFSFFSYQGDGNWNKHTQGTILLLQYPTMEREHEENRRSEIISRCADQYSGAEFYRRIQERGLFLGEGVRWLEQVWSREGEALAQLRLPYNLKTSSEYEMGVHPGVFDACAQLFHAALSRSTDKDTRYIVTKWEDFACINQPVDQVLWCHVVLQDSPQIKGQLKGRFHLFDQNGTLVAQVRSSVMKGLNKAQEDAFRKYLEKPEHTKEQKNESKIISNLRGISQDQWRNSLNDYLQGVFAPILKMEVNELNTDESLMDLGMDSIIGLEAKTKLEEELGIFLPIELFITGLSIRELTESIIPLLAVKPLQMKKEIRGAPLPAYKMDIHSWIVHHKSKPQARVKLFCFPYGAGGGASLYRGWQALLPDYVEVCPVQLPGKENRVKEKAFTDVRRATDVLKQVILPELDRPYAFYGHSIGAFLAYRLAHKLWSEIENKPGHLFVGAYSSPTILPNPLLSLTREKFKERGYDDIPDQESLSSLSPEKIDEILAVIASVLGADAIFSTSGASAELLRLLLPTTLAELQMVRDYNMVDKLIFDVPITAFHGKMDDEVMASEVSAWQELTRGSFNFHTLPGDHLFLLENQDQKQLLELISHDLEKYK